MGKATRLSLEEIAEYFGELEDPWTSIHLLHPLIRVAMIAWMAALAGSAAPTAIAAWAAMKDVLLLTCLDLPNGIPRTDVFRRVLAACALAPNSPMNG